MSDGPIVAQLIGGAGTGKTTELLSIMEKTLAAGVPDPYAIGFMSFTRAARREGSTRAAAKFGIDKPERLETDGWFRTLHSVCFRCLGIKSDELLADNKESREWLQEVFQERVGGVTGGDMTMPEVSTSFEEATSADIIMQLWQAARNRLVSLRTVVNEAQVCLDRVPAYSECVALIERYEQRKRLDGRLDFTDLLGMFAGVRFSVEGPIAAEPEGWLPDVPVWFLDEMQDCSALLDAVTHRLVSKSKWAYVVGDPFQAIYGFAGADARHFMNWPIKEGKRRIMPKSYRCPPPILRMGERFLRGCSDYWDRGIEPADREGKVQSATISKQLFAEIINPADSWLLIARTNFHAKRMATMLDQNNIPWTPTRGTGGWDAPVRNSALGALYDLEKGAPIDGAQWANVLKNFPSREAGVEYLTRGTKTKFEDMTSEQLTTNYPWVQFDELSKLGATPAMMDAIRTRRWRTMVDRAESFVNAVERWGRDVVNKPQVRVGSIHSVKGSEADNVILNMSLSEPVVRSQQTTAGADEERRIFYVGATRSRSRLILAGDRRAKHTMSTPLTA